MGCGYFLHRKHDLTFYEQNDYPGGHTNTITVDEEGVPVHMDTGFMVYNEVTYPNLTRLFRELEVPTTETSMSFSVNHVPSGLEWCGSGVNGIFGQRRNLFRPSFYRFLSQVSRFNSESIETLDNPAYATVSLAEYVREKGFGDDFVYKYLIPMSSAVWSSPPDMMLRFPAQTLIRFFSNHGFLGLNTQHRWRTVVGGSRSYRDLLIAPFREKIHCGRSAVRVTRGEAHANVRGSDGSEEQYDMVILACHADEALQLLDNPLPVEVALLTEFR